MHAPDGFYTIGLCLVIDAACLGILTYCIKRVWGKLNRKTLLLAASVGALIFAIEMANFPVSKGSSCHFMGGVFASIMLGPYLATIIVSLMHCVQFFVFQDGGLLSLGPNLLTIAIISTFLGYYLYKTMKNLVIEPYGTYVGAFISAWLTLLMTSITVCIMLAVSGVESFITLLGPMVGPHVMVGVIEGVITILLLAVMAKMNPGFLGALKGNLKGFPLSSLKEKGIKIWTFLLILGLLTGIFVSPFASRAPEGLEKLALDRGFIQGHEVVYYRAPLSDYQIPGMPNGRMGKGMAGLLGVMMTFGVCFGMGAILMPKKEEITTQAKLGKVVSH